MYDTGNKSFVLRATRMSPLQKRSYAELYPKYGVDPAASLCPDDLFPGRSKERPFVVELGFGMGYALSETADVRRDWDFLGVEVHKPGLGKVMSEIERRGLDNLRVIESDAVSLLRDRLVPDTVSGLHIFFPDPWPKKRHHKRRLVREGFPELVAPLIRRDGYCYLVTDWEDYAWQMRRTFDDHPLFSNCCDGFAPRADWRVETAFERKGRAKGHTIYEMRYLPSR